MRTIFRYILVFAICAAVMRAAPGKAEAEKLLAQLPSYRALADARAMVVPGPAGESPREAVGKSGEALAFATAQIERAKEVIPKLRPLLTVRSSVFDYPGLLACGEVHWLDYAREYEVRLGVYLRPTEGRGPYDFKVTFDEKGTITSVTDIVWKH